MEESYGRRLRKMTNPQQHITQREYIIDIEKFDKLIDRYVNGTFAFSKSELSETIEEILEISRKCITDREKSHNNQQCIGKIIKELEKRLNHSKKHVYGFTAEEAGWVGGREDGLTEAILLLQEGSK
jgi:hypothetical protein